jgi:hypothetical protein
MTWPTFPSDNDTATINGIKFIYDGTSNVWNREGFVFDTLAADSYTVANLVVTRKSQLGAASNVFIGGGSPGLFLTSDGAAGLAWTEVTLSAGISNGTSNIIVGTSGNATVAIGGTQDVAVFSSGGANIKGYANITGAVTASAVTTGLITSNVATGTAPFVVASTTRVANLNVERANLSDSTLVTRQTSGLYYPTFVSGNSTSNYAVVVNPNLSFDTSSAILNTINLNITSNANVGNLNATTNVNTSNISVTTTANFTGSDVSLGTVSNVKLAGGSSGQYLQTDGTGNLSWRTATVSIVANGSSNVNVVSGGNIIVSAAGNTGILVATGTGVNVAGYLNVTGNIVGSASLDVTNNINASILQSNVATGTSPLNVTSTTRVNNLNVARANISDYTSVTTTSSGIVYPAFANSSATSNYALQSNTAIYANLSSGNLHAINFIGNLSGNITGTASSAGTVTTNAQPSITSVGALSNLTVSNPSGSVIFTNTANVSLGAISNVHITGGTVGQYLQTDGVGNLSWESISFSVVESGTSNVGIPIVNGNINQYVNSNLTLTVTGTGANVTGYANITENITSGGNLIVAGNVSASTLTSNIATGTAPLTVTSTTRVNNLNVARANISDYTTVTTVSSSNMFFAFANASSTGNYSLNSNTAIYANLSNSTIYAANYVGNIISSNSVTSNYFVGNGTYLTALPAGNLVGTVPLSTAATTAGTVTTAAQPNITSVGTLSGLSVGGLSTLQQTTEILTPLSGATGVVVHDINNGSTFYHSGPAADFIINFTNVPTTNNRTIALTVLVVQGTTAYVPSAIYINGVSGITLNWLAATAPSGTASRTDLFGFTLTRVNNAWIAYAYTTYFG